MNDYPAGYPYPPEVRFEFYENDVDSYRRTADYLNFSNVDVVCVQHEYGIYGGPAGSFILPLLRDLRIPIVTTLHTLLQKPDSDQRRVLHELSLLSSRLVVMSERGRTMLREIYGVAEHKIDLIPHGIPDMPFTDSNFFKDQFGVEGKQVLLTFGLLSPNKGIETVLRALPEIVKAFPKLVYIVLGATHPNLVRDHGEAYRLSLERLAQDLGIRRHVSFYNRFVELEELKCFLGAADIYITPYLNAAQITSGTLAYAMGSGKAIISTPYWHAEELLADDRGVLVPFGDSSAVARAVISLLKDESQLHALRKRAYLHAREMIWSNSAKLYMESFEKARRNPVSPPQRRHGVRTLEEERLELPELRLDHLMQMTDSIGMFQQRHLHATQFRPRLLHRRQRARADRHASSRGARIRSAEPEAPRANLCQLSSTRFSSRDEKVFATSWDLIARGWSRLARLTARRGHSGRSAPVSVDPASATCNSGPHSSSSRPSLPFSNSTHRARGPSLSSASTNIFVASAATAWRPRPAMISPGA